MSREMSVFRSTLENQFVTALNSTPHGFFLLFFLERKKKDCLRRIQQKILLYREIEGKMKMRSDKWKFMFDRQLILGDSFHERK
jgi:hypothetical protein